MENKPKILFILPPSFLYPMGAAYIATVLSNAGYSFDTYGFFYDNRAWLKGTTKGTGLNSDPVYGPVLKISALKSQSFLYELIASEKYDYILVGGLIGFFRWFYQILPPVKGYNPKSIIIMGGGITKDLPENVIFEKLCVDYILKGEAETNLIELLTLLSRQNTNLSDMSSVPGLCWKDSTSAIRKNPTERFDLYKNDILPAWEAFYIEEYIKLSDTLFRYDMTFFPIMAGRGCPNVCAFCSPSVGRFSPRSVDSIISEMKLSMEKYAFDFFFIYSEVAFDKEEFAREFCKKYKDAIGKPWVGQLRTDVRFSVETYTMMKESGCMFISMGIESACDRVLKVMNKQTSMNDTMRNLEQAKEAGINVFGNFMFGHDTERAEEIRTTFDFLNQHDLISGPSNGLATLIIYPGTAYYKVGEKKGLIDDPFKFLLTYSLKAGISDVTLREKENTSLNISSLSNDEFYEVVCTENIKHRRLFSKRHQAVEIEKNFRLGREAGFVFHGICPTCGYPVTFDPQTYQNPLNISKLCKNCFYMVHINIFQFTETKNYLEQLKIGFKKSKKIVVYGSWIMDLIFCDALSIPYEKIIAWVDPENPEVSNFKYFYHMPQLSLDKLKEYEYDTIITLRPRVHSTPKIIENHGLNPQCNILNLLPDILNTDLAEVLRGKTIAIAGTSAAAQKVKELLDTENSLGRIDHFSDVLEICNENSKYDFVIFDKDEYGIDRQESAQNSRYRINEILHVEFLYDGGFYTRY